MKVVALTACHNRKSKTLAALSDLTSQQMPPEVTLEIVVVDDGSSDGTELAIIEAFPLVQVIRGSGDLYWAGGMRRGFRHVCDDFDYLLVFNDDIRIDRDGLFRLLAVCLELRASGKPDHAVCGSLVSASGSEITYGGYQCTSRLFPLSHRRVQPGEGRLEIDTFNMNFALISREAIDRADGFLADYFVHAEADIEFGRRLGKRGGTCWLAPGSFGECDRDPDTGTYREPGIGRMERLTRYSSVKAWPFRQRLRYCWYYGGATWIVAWLAPYVKILLFNRA